MKLIKKIAAIMFAFMMVVSMSCNVKADEGTTATTEKGEITIDKAIDGQTYTIYKLLDLESYDEPNNHYSYRPSTEWKNFFETTEAKNYITVDENGYANWVKGADQTEFAQKALAYATTNGIGNKGTAKASNNTVTFKNLDLGYYLVDSSVGALCLLDTTNPTATIQEKNGVPSVEKTIEDGGVLATDHKSNSVNIGDIVTFQTMIDVKKGAQGYELHDTLSTGLKLISKINDHTNSPIMAVASGTDESGKAFNNNLTKDSHYTITYDDHSFTVTILDSYLKTHETVDYHIAISYKAILTNAAVVGGAGNANETYLKYGVSSESTPSTTTTYTFGIPVFKYTETNTALAGAKFKLYTDAQCKDENVVKVIANGKDYVVGETDDNNNVMTSGTEAFNINGLKAGTYYLKEIEAPKGYNKLANAIKVEITNDGKVKVEKNGALTDVTQVDVENKTGTVLPSTGGMGTTMIYLVGAVLVLGSGVVLATKRRVKNK
ncbi:SpaH/EbpB family LPXTG-anchored major pilin [Holdemanella porci]|uniref:SpaH/EbpB family LPXTG-anchored major pilin n=1 Tax=Holdemanella porci TaxID=2652276 RepID=UPI001D148047|nr:SpaH/EbpB family LPXTG-anchored major pilin [Holdemanella porci]MCC3361584.1 SpaH/EbpB family LPXTG-anchored major pilin [Holdemanella porci]